MKRPRKAGLSDMSLSFPGANTQVETLEETRENLKDAVEMLLDCYREDAEAKISTSRGTRKEELILQTA